MQTLDIHTHKPAPSPRAIVALDAVELARQYSSASEIKLCENQLYSVGIHPWATVNEVPRQALLMLRELAENPQVVAIGEAGADTVKGGMMFRQLNILREQILLSEKTGKPLIIHNVKAHDIILGLHAEMDISMPWAIHGFRAKPSVARMFTSKGIYLSFGELFNAETLRCVPGQLLLAETDESTANIEAVIAKLSAAHTTDLTQTVAENCTRFLRAGH